MLEEECEQLIGYIEEMISNGIQLVHDGHLLSWSDTKILGQIAKVKEKKEGVALSKLNPGDQLKHKVSKQDMWVINDDGKTVFFNTGTPIIKYPLSKISNEFVIVKRTNRIFTKLSME